MIDEKYYWTPGNELTLDNYLQKRRPSIVTKDDTEWIYIGKPSSEDSGGETKVDAIAKAICLGKVVVDKLTVRVKAIESDSNIPRNAKNGKRSKKSMRDELGNDAAKELQKIVMTTGYTEGKLMLFVPPEQVDAVWTQIGRSVAHGPLHEAGVTNAKVSPTRTDSPSSKHLFCIYIDNAYDTGLIRKVATVLLKDHGLDPTGAKSNLYNHLGIDSSHPSQLRPTTFRLDEVFGGGAEGIKALKAQYDPKVEKERNKTAATAAATDGQSIKPGANSAKRQHSNATDKKPVAKRPKTAATMYKEGDMFAGSDDEEK